MSAIHFQRTYQLHESYEIIKEKAQQELCKYLQLPGLFIFNDSNRSLTFTSERLIPPLTKHRPRIMLLFSNPHPLSVHTGMFLSPSAIGRENLFWPVMEGAGWLPIPEIDRTSPEKLANICLNLKYDGPFEFIFYCYYAFPTDYPQHIQRIFGKEYFQQIIEPEAASEFKEIIQETSVEAVVTFNKSIFNLVSKNPINTYIKRLVKGELIQSQVRGLEKQVPIFLTFPTGYFYHKDFMQLRMNSLVAIGKALYNGE
jgi:hypothetical protein